jgi:TrmH family RNA methyltransferase
MISLRKLSSLADSTRMRKTAILIRDFERDLINGTGINRFYLRGLLVQVSEDGSWPEALQGRAKRFASTLTEDFSDEIVRELNSLRHEMLVTLGRDWADWDMETPGDDVPRGVVPGDRSSTLPIRVFLDGLRSPFNVGSIMRTSLAFGVEKIWISPEGASPNHRRAKRSAMGAAESLSWDICPLNELPTKEIGTIFALEVGGTGISDFHFPENGTVIIGSEELGVSPGSMNRAQNDGGIVSIPMPGPKASINVGVAFGILVRQWVDSIVGKSIV